MSTTSVDASACASVEPPRKKNRWGAPVDGNNEYIANTADRVEKEDNKEKEKTNSDGVVDVQLKLDNQTQPKRERKSRWAKPNPAVVPQIVNPVNAVMTNPLMAGQAQPQLTQQQVQQVMVLKIQLQETNQRLLNVVQDALAMEQNPNRSPSPPPKYDSNGKRTNTREIRMREKLTEERGKIVEELVKLNPHFVAGVTEFNKTRPTRTVYLPNDNPTMNYIGLIIGPRGNTQRQMEQETGTKISIRGKGSSKQSFGRQKVGEDEELHVFISGDSEESVEKAVAQINQIIHPSAEAISRHKEKQLRELALINGTLREDEYCPICGEKGHRQYECVHRSKAFKTSSVKCSICGDLSHPTRDCPLKEGSATVKKETLDTEYDSFMAELIGGNSTNSIAKSASSSDIQDNPNSTVKDEDETKVESDIVSRVGNTTIVKPIIDLFAKAPTESLPAHLKDHLKSHAQLQLQPPTMPQVPTPTSVAAPWNVMPAATDAHYNYSAYPTTMPPEPIEPIAPPSPPPPPEPPEPALPNSYRYQYN